MGNIDYLSKRDILELYFFSTTPEPTEKDSHEAFRFIKLSRPDMNIQKFTKDYPDNETHRVSSLTEDDIFTRRAL